MTVPFIRLLPNGQHVLSDIAVPVDTQTQANNFIAHGGRYFVAKLSEQSVQMRAFTFKLSGEEVEVARADVPNTPVGLLDAVKKLVADSVAGLDAVQ